MKIFNWVHKRFQHHHNTQKDEFVPNMESIEPTKNNADTQALLKQVALPEILGGWNDGILTIGTLGFDPLKPFNQNKEYYALESEYEPEDEVDVDVDVDDGENYNCEHEEQNPLMNSTKIEHNFEDAVSANNNACKEEVVINLNNEIVVIPSSFVSHEVLVSKEGENDEKKKRGERITLAELFLADSDVKMKVGPTKVLVESNDEKSSHKAKHGLSFTKKLINPHPIRDIKKMMKKMLKRKIHPELDVNNQKPEGQKVSFAAGVKDNHKHEAKDTTSLLSIQGTGY